MGSHSRTSSSSANTQDIKTLNLSDLTGTTIADSEDVEINTNIEAVDAGTVDAAQSIASDANDLARHAVDANTDFGMAALDYAHDTFEQAADLSGGAIDAALNRAAESQDAAFDFGRLALQTTADENRRSTDTIADIATSTNATLAGAINAAAAATRSDANDIINNIVRYGALVAAAIAAAYLLRGK